MYADDTVVLAESEGEMQTSLNVLHEYCEYNGNLSKTIQNLYEKKLKAMFSLLCKARSVQLPIDLQLHLFDKVVTPIILYGCEVWGFESCKILHKL